MCWPSGVCLLAEAGTFSLHHCIQTGCGAHTASYSMGTGRDVSPGVKLTTHFHLVSKLRIPGAIISLPHTSS